MFRVLGKGLGAGIDPFHGDRGAARLTRGPSTGLQSTGLGLEARYRRSLALELGITLGGTGVVPGTNCRAVFPCSTGNGLRRSSKR